MTIKTPTGTFVTVTPGHRWTDGEAHWTGHETPETLAQYKYIVQPEPVVPKPTPAEVAASALVQAEMEARMARERLVTAAEFEALIARVTVVEKALGIVPAASK